MIHSSAIWRRPCQLLRLLSLQSFNKNFALCMSPLQQKATLSHLQKNRGNVSFTLLTNGKKYSCREREVTLQTESELGLTLEPNADYPNNAVVSLGYHYDCYKRFCDQNKINRKKTTKANTPQIQGNILGPSRLHSQHFKFQ